MLQYQWENTAETEHVSYKCGYCDSNVAPSEGYYSLYNPPSSYKAFIYICPNCNQPTFVGMDLRQMPQPLLGSPISRIQNQDVELLYQEARACTSFGAYTASVMICRKILMNLAVQEGASEGESFVSYVNYLFDNGFVPPKGKGWVDSIRKRGNSANHEIKLMNEKDATLMLHFVEGLLRFNFELPNMLEEDNKD
jgi:hypothetical protein